MSCHEEHTNTLGNDYGESLLQLINIDNVTALNEAINGSAKLLLREWDDRFDNSKYCYTDENEDKELLLFIPFISNVTLKSFSLICPSANYPSSVKIYINQDNLDFETVNNCIPIADFSIIPDSEASVKYYLLPRYKFYNVRSITFYFDNISPSAEFIQLNFLYLRGSFSKYSANTELVLSGLVYDDVPKMAYDHPVNNLIEVKKEVD